MYNYKMIIQYDGSRYNGWQRQGNVNQTIQQRFENVLSIMCDEKIEIFASGRTDAGVHAMGQVANFKCRTEFACEEILSYVNRYLPEDIKVITVEQVDERFHSRLCATSKTYEYTLATEKPDVFVRKYVYHTYQKPDARRMECAAEKLIGTHDFHGFSSLGKTKKSTVRTINSIEISEKNGMIKIKVNGNGFLYNMMRILAGTLYEIGIGEKSVNVIDDILRAKDRQYAGATLPACGLTLLEVFY